MQLPKELKLEKNTTAPIVQVDDDEVLIKIVEKFHKKSGIKNPYLSFLNGDDFIEYLQNVHQEAGEELPLLVLLDINMPGKDGFEVLKEIRSNSNFKEIPMCSMLSSSTYQEDIDKSKELGANSYIVKPDGAREYKDFFEEISLLTGE